MSLPNSNISTTAVSQAIGLGSHNVGTLCAKARSGGASGWAFRIKELGYSEYDGVLIDGAQPYFNIWSACSPAEFAFVNNTIACRLKRDANGKYCYRLGKFANYNHSATPLSFTGTGDTATYSSDNLPTYHYANFTVNLGSYDFRNMGGGSCFTYRIVMRRSSDNYLVGVTYGDLAQQNFSSTVAVPLSSMASTMQSYTATLEFENAVNGVWYAFPNYSFLFSIQVIQQSNNINVNLPLDSSYYAIIGRTYESDRHTITIQSLTDTAQQFNLSFIEINIADSNGNIINTATYSPDGTDTAAIYGMSYGQQILLTAHCGASSGRIYATGNQRTIINMIFN